MSVSESNLPESEQRLRIALEAGRLGVWEWETATGRVSWSPGLEEIHGQARGTFGATFDSVLAEIHPEDRQRFLATVQRALEKKSGFHVEYRIVLPDRSIRWVEGRGNVFCDSQGAPERMIGVCLDISDRQQTQETLRQTEERYRTIVETANEGIWLIDAEARTLYANRRMGEMLGYTPEQMLGRTVWEFCFPEDAAFGRERIGANIAGQPEQFDSRFRRHDGGELLTLSCTSPVRDSQGNVIGALGMFSDVTERRQADNALKASEAKLRAFLESASQGVVATDSDGKIVLVNAKTEEMFGYARDSLVGQSLEILLPESLRSAHIAHRADYFAHPHTRPMGVGLDLLGRKKDGTTFPVEISLSFTDEGGSQVALGFITDITERKRFEERLRETAKLESLGVLAGGIAHDFNNLLTGILGNASLALQGLAPFHPSRTLMEEIVIATELAAKLTQQMLAYSGKGKFLVEPVDLSELLRGIGSILQASISRTIQLQLELSDSLPAIEADVAQLHQLVMNLVINAAEAIGKGPGVVRVRTGVRDIDGSYIGATTAGSEIGPGQYVYVEIQDNGCGMDAATKARIFDPFFTTKFTGRGLGLAATLGIVRGHKGAIQVDSTPGRGSTFTVLFPAAFGQVAAAQTEAELEPSEDLAGSGVILVVDDEKIVRHTASSTLTHYGYRVVLAEHGQQAIDIFQKMANEIVLVVLDMTMPVMSGEETLRHLKDVNSSVPILLSSGFSETEAERRFQGLGLAGFVQKPYTAERLAEKVKSIRESASRCGMDT